jgi:tRNA-binding protein
MATIEDFEKLDIRVGKIIEAEDFPLARKPGYKLKIDFGPEIGIKNSFSQLVALYTKEELVGKIVLGVINFPIRKIGPYESEVLTLGVTDSENKVVLIVPEKETAVLGGRLS